MLKKIGILTYHYAINEGAILQAYSLSNVLAKYFGKNRVEIIDYHPKRTENKYLISILSVNPIFAIRKLQRYLRLKIFIQNELPLSKKRLITDNYDKALSFLKGKYDLIIVGSDEVWSVQKDWLPFPNVYWLGRGLGCKKVAFAASANKTNLAELRMNEKKWMKASLEKFDLIGVRDKHTFDLVKSLGIKNLNKLTKVPDPTFMYQIKNTNVKERLIKLGIDLEKPILGILLLDAKLSAEVRRYYGKKGYQIMALSIFNRYADVNLFDKLNPFEWAEVFKYMTFCITDRMHGVINCLKNQTPFIGVDDEAKYLILESKIYSLLRDFSLLDNYVNIKKTNYDFDNFFYKAEQAQKNWNVNKITPKLDQMKRSCNIFIKRIEELLM